MQLQYALEQCQTYDDYNQIFDKTVTVFINTWRGIDQVAVDTYAGSVTTDFIAERICNQWRSIRQEDKQPARKLAVNLEVKVFAPLRDLLEILDAENCTSTLLYKIRNCARIFYTPEDENLTHGYPVLKHSMCTMFLYQSYV